MMMPRNASSPRSSRARPPIGVRQELRRRAAIHPRQVAVINDVFAPTADELAAARDLLARYEGAQAAGKGVMISDDGTMADEATVRHARRILGLRAEG